jgi:hypothetical protein
MESEIVKNEVFPFVIRRIKERKESLVNMGIFKATGIEGWFKVEVVTALAGTKHAVKALRNKGPDLHLESEIDIELKGATDFNISYLRSEMKRHGTFLLFLQNGSDRDRIKKLASYDDVELLCHETFSDGTNEWIIGLIY